MLVPCRVHRESCGWLPHAFRLFASQPLQSVNQCWQVSSHGRCRNTRGVVSHGSLHPSGYRFVHFVGRNWQVHRVVKLTFHGLPPDQQAWQVHHRDGNKVNNCLDNLEFVTPGQNVLYSYQSDLRRHSGPKQSKPVLWRALGSKNWNCVHSIASAAEQLGISVPTVWRCCHRNCSANGIEFQFQHVGTPILCGEEWRPMQDPISRQDVPGRMVNSFGRITSSKGLVGFGTLSSDGYFRTTLLIAGNGRSSQVHRLVAFSFLGPPPTPEHSCVNHKDGNKSNNALENLEWTTPSQNMNHYFANAGASPKSRNCKSIWSRPHGSNHAWTWHPSMTSCATTLGTRVSSISNCVRGTLKQAGGHEFARTESEETLIPGEEWREVEVELLLKDKALRK